MRRDPGGEPDGGVGGDGLEEQIEGWLVLEQQQEEEAQHAEDDGADKDGQGLSRDIGRYLPFEGFDVVAAAQVGPEVEHDDGEGGGLDAAAGGARTGPDEHQHDHHEESAREHVADGGSVEAGGAGGDGLEVAGHDLLAESQPGLFERVVPLEGGNRQPAEGDQNGADDKDELGLEGQSAARLSLFGFEAEAGQVHQHDEAQTAEDY